MSEDKNSHYQANIRVGKAVVFSKYADDLNKLIVLVNTKVEAEVTGTEGEIIDLTTKEVVYCCRKQAANE